MSARKDIKNAIVTALTNVSGLVGTRVYKGKHNLTAGTAMPLIYIWMQGETTDTQTLTVKRFQMRNLTIMVDFWAKAATPAALEDALDEASEIIRTAALADSKLGGKAEDILLTNTDYLYEGDEAEPFGLARLSFMVKYFSREP